MTDPVQPPRPSGGESDWIDRVLYRAGEHVSGQVPRQTAAAAPAAAAPPATAPPAAAGPSTAPPVEDQTAPMPIVPVERPLTNELNSIQWAEEAEVRPASEPIANQPAAQPLTPDAVGRSAWADELSGGDEQDPEGWNQLSWNDMAGADPEAQEFQVAEPSSFLQFLREWGPVVIAAVAIALLTRLVLVQAYHIPSSSMVPTLEEGDRVVVNRLSYRFGEVERGQVVVFTNPPSQVGGENDLIKRVIALPGETIEFRSGEVYVDGLLAVEPYLLQPSSTTPRGAIPGCDQPEPETARCVIPDDFVFVMGDNREGSADSRLFGPIPADTIVGRAFLKVWPLGDIGGL